MDEHVMLELLKLHLQRTGASLDPLLRAMLKQAADHIGQTGIVLRNTEEDGYLQIDYAAYLYRRRANPESEMPKSLKWDLTNRLLREKGRVDG